MKLKHHYELALQSPSAGRCAASWCLSIHWLANLQPLTPEMLLICPLHYLLLAGNHFVRPLCGINHLWLHIFSDYIMASPRLASPRFVEFKMSAVVLPSVAVRCVRVSTTTTTTPPTTATNANRNDLVHRPLLLPLRPLPLLLLPPPPPLAELLLTSALITLFTGSERTKLSWRHNK